MEEKKIIRKEDNLWKVIMEELFTDFISFLHPGIEQVLDLERGYQFLDKELEQVFHSEEEAGSTKLVDKLVRVYSHDGKEEITNSIPIKYRRPRIKNCLLTRTHLQWLYWQQEEPLGINFYLIPYYGIKHSQNLNLIL